MLVLCLGDNARDRIPWAQLGRIESKREKEKYQVFVDTGRYTRVKSIDRALRVSLFLCLAYRF